MPPKKKKTEELPGIEVVQFLPSETTTVVPEPVVVKPPKPLAPVEAVAPVRVRRNVISFTQWAKQKGVKSRHFAGMQAFLTNPDRSLTLEEWDEIFSKY